MRNRTMVLAALLVALAAMAARDAGAAEGDSASSAAGDAGKGKDYVYVTGEQDSLSPSGSGAGGGIDWIHSIAHGRMSTTLGYARLNLAGSTVGYLKLGAHWQNESKLAYYVEARGGAGNQSTGPFDYQTLKGGLVFPVVERLSLGLEDEYLHVAQTKANLVKSTMTYVPLTWFGTVVKYQGTTAGTVTMNFLSGELDFYVNGLKIYGGYGSGNYILNQNFAPVANVVLKTQEVFYGVKFPLGTNEVDIILDSISQPGSKRRSLILGWKFPV